MPPISAGTAFIDIVPNLKSFIDGLQKDSGKIKKQLEGIGKQTEKSFEDSTRKVKLIAAGVSAAAIGFAVQAGKSFADWGGQVRVLTRELGVSVETASRLAFTGRQLGLEVSQLSVGFGRLSRLIADDAKVLKDLNIAVKTADGRIRSFEQILGDLADVFKTLPDGPQKTALALELFGRSGKELIPLLNQGRDGFEKFAKQADELGFTLNTKSLEAIKRYKVAQRDLSAAVKGFNIQVGEKTLPVMTFFTERLRDAAIVVNKLPAPLVAVGAGAVAASGGFFTFVDGLNNTVQATRTLVGWLGRLRSAKIAAAAVERTAVAANFLGGVDVGRLPAAGGLAAAITPITLGLTAGAAALALWAKRNAEAADTAKDFAVALRKERDGIRGLTDELILAKLASSGTLERFQKLGISADLLTEAVKGDGDALRQLRTSALDADFVLGSVLLRDIDKLGQGFRTGKREADALTLATNQLQTTFAATTPKILEFAGQTGESFKNWRFSTVDGLNFVKGSLSDLAGQANLTAQKILEAFRKQLEAQARYRTNFESLVKRGLPEDFRKQLADMGAQGALLVQALAEANHKQFNEIVRTWDAAGKQAQGTTRAIAGISDAILAIPSDTQIRIGVVRRGGVQEFQHGGIVTRPTLGLVGEAGPEAIIPLDRLSASGAGGITIIVQGNVTTERELVEAVRRGVLETKRRNGRAGLA